MALLAGKKISKFKIFIFYVAIICSENVIFMKKTDNLTSISVNTTRNASFFCYFRDGTPIQMKEESSS